MTCQVQLSERDRKILDHYQNFFGEHNRILTHEVPEAYFGSALFVVEFAAATAHEDWRYMVVDA